MAGDDPSIGVSMPFDRGLGEVRRAPRAETAQSAVWVGDRSAMLMKVG
jgi:hypothetical protein